MGYSGLAPQLAGLYQVNLTVPAGLAANDYSLDIGGPDSYSSVCKIAVGSAAALRHFLTPFPKPVPGNELVESGAYGRVRHPIYSGVVLAALGWSLLSGSWPAAALSLILAVLFDAKSRREEDWLSEAHPEYAAYRLRTRRFIPGVY